MSISREYDVRFEERGVSVRDALSGAQFYCTEQGIWFLLMGSGSPFDEDAQLDPGDWTDNLNAIIATAKQNQDQSTSLPSA